MEYVFRLYSKTRIWEQDIASDGAVMRVGSGEGDRLRVPAELLPPAAFEVRVAAGGWDLQGRRGYGGISRQALEFERPVRIDGEKGLAATVYARGSEPKRVDIHGQKEITVGRSSGCDVSLSCRQVSGRHFSLSAVGGGLRLRDLGSTNGTYVNGQKITEGSLYDGDRITMGFCSAVVEGTSLVFRCHGKITVSLPETERGVYTADSVDDPYPYEYKASPRLAEELPSVRIELQPPPSQGGKPETNWLSVLLAPVLLMAVMLTLSLTVLDSMNTLYLMLPTTAVSVLTTVLRLRSEKTRYRKNELLRTEKYRDYLREQTEYIERLMTAQRRILNSVNPDADDCVRAAGALERSLWDRKGSDVDFMELRLGLGSVKSCVSITAPRRTLTLNEDELAGKPEEIAERYAFTSDCPITLSLCEAPVCGVIGNRASAVSEAKNLVVQAAAHHSYAELRMVFVFDKAERGDWEFARWLPHVFDDTRNARYMADSPASARKLLDDFADILAQRAAENSSSEYGVKPSHRPFYLFVCASAELMAGHRVMRYLNAADGLGCASLFLFDRLENLPQECQRIVEVYPSSGYTYESRSVSAKTKFVPDHVDKSGYDRFARALAPVRVPDGAAALALPTNVSFMQGYGARSLSMLNVEKNWADPRPEESMAVAIGVAAGEETFTFDINEKGSGPHGIIAGMTGSGKSETVQTWILAMAVKFPPEAVSFVLIDFKGTGLLLPFKNLPHLAGAISDLDVSITANLVALQHELTRRKELLDKNGVTSISAYRRLLRAGKASEPMPYLFVVIDEFAEFKLRFPEFMPAVNSIFAIGRALGVQIILLTQKPGSVVDDKMQANIRFRWCLKVANSSDSRDMLGRPDAAKITNAGRVIVRVGEDEVYEEIQSFWCGAPYAPERDLRLQRLNRVSFVDLYGGRVCYEPEKTMGFRTDKSEIDAVVNWLDAYARKNGFSRARAVWMPSLPETLYLNDLVQISFDGENADDGAAASLRPVIGIADDPRSQSQYPLRLNLSDEGNIAVYGAQGSGKTTFLQTAILSMALTYTPEQLHIYLLDCGGGSLTAFAGLPQVGGVAVGGRDDEKVKKLLELLEREMDSRKALISSGGGTANILSYMEATGRRLPFIVLAIDNFGPLFELYPYAEPQLRRFCSSGPSFGIYVLLTASSVNGVSYKISQYMNVGIALRMKDRGDYASIVGRTGGLEPKDTPGRGLVKQPNGVLEFQTALPASGETESERLRSMRELVSMLCEKWRGARPEPIPVLPERVSLSDIREDGIALGLRFDNVSPLCVDPGEQPFITVSCAEKCDGFVSTVLGQYSSLPCARFISFDGLTGLVRDGGAERRLNSAEDFDAAVDALMPFMQRRKESTENGGSGAFEPVVLLLTDLKKCFDAMGDNAARQLDLLVRLGGKLGVIVAAAGGCADIQTLYNMGVGFVNSLILRGACAAVGGNLLRHGFVNSSAMPFTERDSALAADEGYFSTDGKLIKFKAVTRMGGDGV